MNTVGTIHVGVAVIIKNGFGEILVGQRLGKHGYGTWSPSGGHLEFGETIEECAKREVLEETGMIVTDVRQLVTISDVVTEVALRQYVTIWVEVDVEKLKPMNSEPEKCAGWYWHNLFQVPAPHFLAFSNYLKSIITSGIYDDPIIHIPKVTSDLKPGDYVFASYYSDGIPGEPWRVGYIAEVRADFVTIVDGGTRGYRHALKITEEQGHRICGQYPDMERQSTDHFHNARVFGIVPE